MKFKSVIELIKKHPDLFTILGLLLVFYFLFFHNMWAYPLIDVDETRYVSMSKDMVKMKDYLTLYLNGEYFFEKPPLYFWLESLSFLIFGKINEVTARIPVSLCATFACLMTYFAGKKIISRKYGIIAALILATSLQFIALSRIAILDLLLSTCIATAIYLGFMTLFCKEENKKFFWFGMYVFSALAVLAKGIPGLVLPFATIFLAYLLIGKVKEFFNPKYILPGIFLFLAIALPWHLAMFKMHDPLFFNEYIVKHHLARFVNSEGLGRKQPWFFYILVFLGGFIPWMPSFVAMIVTKTKELIKNFNKNFFSEFKWDELAFAQKFGLLNFFAFIIIFVFFSAASTKLPTYILPAFFPAAFLLADFWCGFMFEDKNKKPIAVSMWILNSIFIIASVVAFFSFLFLPTQIVFDIQQMKPFVIALFFVVPFFGLIALQRNKRVQAFASYVIFMLFLSIIATGYVFQLNCKFGQDDLMDYAKYAKTKSSKLATFDFGRRYSVLYYYDDKVIFQQEPDYVWLKGFLKKDNTVVIVKNKNMEDLEKNAKYKILKTGRKYTLITKED